MTILISVALLLLGIVVLVMVHIWVVGMAFRIGLRDNNNVNITNRTNLGSTSMSRDEVEKLPCFAFKAKDQCSSPADCAVCLDRFKAGEKCRLLPLCRHSFHAECVDAWLLKTPVCPICRARADNVTAIAISDETETSNIGSQDVGVTATEVSESIDNPEEGEERAQLNQETVWILDDNRELGEGQESSTQHEQETVSIELGEGQESSTQQEQETVRISDGSMELAEGQEISTQQEQETVRISVGSLELGEGQESSTQQDQESVRISDGSMELGEGQESSTQLEQETIRISDDRMKLDEGQESSIHLEQDTIQIPDDDFKGTEYCECSIDNSNEVERRQTPPKSDDGLPPKRRTSVRRCR